MPPNFKCSSTIMSAMTSTLSLNYSHLEGDIVQPEFQDLSMIVCFRRPPFTLRTHLLHSTGALQCAERSQRQNLQGLEWWEDSLHQ
ncbi:hypothetical protein Pint_22201 [Pistacia integerrima]|uniref:Uncharacterized protein n=1 Tax=Pistacia integerrima TaxID=434235 RepID=A0ACC0YH05_9ROSI|nr:hypothetical protein Pint_22201 [Pistacia integerrima]